MNNNILIVDDEPDVLTYLKMILSQHDYVIETASSVDDAMLLLKDFQPDLICLDIMMPKKSGITFYSEIKKDPKYKTIPVVIISGIVQSEDFDFNSLAPDLSLPPPDRFVEKPVNVSEFAQLIGELLKKANKSGKAVNDG